MIDSNRTRRAISINNLIVFIREALGESVHGYLDVGVGAVDSLLCEASELGAEDESRGLADVEVADHGVVFVGQCSYDAVTLAVEVVVGLLDGVVGVVVDPFGGSYGHIASGIEGIAGFDNMDILHAEAVAGAQYGGGVVGLVDIFEHHGDVAGAQGRETIEEGASLGGDEVGGALIEGLFLGKGERGEREGGVGLSLRHGLGIVILIGTFNTLFDYGGGISGKDA